jgi:septum site-determining protein MinC
LKLTFLLATITLRGFAIHTLMVPASNVSVSATFELKSAALTLVAVMLKSTRIALVAKEMKLRFANAPELFNQDPVAIDLSLVSTASEPIDFEALITVLRSHRMLPVAAKAGNATQMAAALAAGLCEAHVQALAPKESPKPIPATPDNSLRSALFIDKPLRSGQRVYAKGGDLIVMAAVSVGAEVIADGHIHVYAPLRGRALAGALGNTSARIFTTCMEPQLLSIAGIYRTTETELPDTVLGKAAQVRLEGERLVVDTLKY